MQTTLLGIGIAIILALGTALVGPFFIDWDGFRPQIESKAAEIIGAPVHIAGPMAVSLLPTTSLRLEGVAIGPAGAPSVTARKLAMELKPTALMRGEFRVDQLVLDGVTATVRLDRNGKVETPVEALGFDPDRVGIDRLTVTHGRIVLADAASGGRVALDNVSFKGEVRSLLGPFKGDGTFSADDRPYTFRLGAGHRGDDGGIRLRLAVESPATAVSFETDGTIWADGGAPRYEGARDRLPGRRRRAAERPHRDQRALAARRQDQSRSGDRDARRSRLRLRTGDAAGTPGRLGEGGVRRARRGPSQRSPRASSTSTAPSPRPSVRAPIGACRSRWARRWRKVLPSGRRSPCRSRSTSASRT